MRKIIFASTIIIATILSCKTNNNISDSKQLNVNFESKSNSSVKGTALFIEKKGVVRFVAKLSGLTPGLHAIHIHENSDCSSVDGSSAGGHWNPTFKKHGQWGQTECHKGDIGNFMADDKGNGIIELSTTEWCIGCEDQTKNILNKGLIVHQGTDDYVSQPAGNAGTRVACVGLIK